jgi:hypothetical protein
MSPRWCLLCDANVSVQSWGHMLESADEAFQAFSYGCSKAGPDYCAPADPRINSGKDIATWIMEDIINVSDLILQSLANDLLILL